MKNSIIRIIVLESDKSLHTVYKNHFDEIADYELVGSYTSANEALKDFSFTRPHIVLSEIALNGTSGIDAIKLFRKKEWGIKIIMFSEINDFDVIKNAFKKGANGYLTKPLTLDKLEHALRSMEKEGAAMSNDIVKKIIHNFIYLLLSYLLISMHQNRLDIYQTVFRH